MTKLSGSWLGKVVRLFSTAGLFLIISLLVACGNPAVTGDGTQPGGKSGDTTGPTFKGFIPALGEVSAPINTSIEVKFDEPLDSQTVSSASMLLFSGSLDELLLLPRQPVYGNVTYSEPVGGGYVATLTPNADLAPDTWYIVVVSGAITDLAGNKPAYIPKYSFKTVKNPLGDTDTTPPTVSATLPVNGATDVAVNRAIVATFSEPMASATIDKDSFTLQTSSSGGTTVSVSGTVSYSGNSATFTPTSSTDNQPALAYDTTYTATITTAVTDVATNKLAAKYQWSFTTVKNTTDTDNIPPKVSVVTPRDKAVGIDINSAISASFDEAVDAASVTVSTDGYPSSFTLSDGTNMVPGVVEYSGTTATFKPAVSLMNDTKYTATLTTAIKDLAGNPLAADYTWSFTTAVTDVPADKTPPTVTAVSPPDGAVGVATNGAISVDFSEALDPNTINTATFTLQNTTVVPAVRVDGSVTYNGTSATFTPLAPLADSNSYTATLDASIADLASNTMTSNYAWSFTTAAAKDETRPKIVSHSPGSGATGVVTNAVVSVEFSEALSPGTVNTSTFRLVKQGNNTPTDDTQVAGAVRYSGSTATFTPLADLETNSSGVIYAATVTTGITDLAGNALESDVAWTFTTAVVEGTLTDTTKPTVVSRTPAPGSTGVSVTINAISAQFSEALDPSTITSASVTVMLGTAPIAGSVLYSKNTITFVPRGNLAFGSTYTVTMKNTITDLAGNPLNVTVVWNFTTAFAVMGGGHGG